MESGGALVSGNAPLAWNDFMDRMRHPSAADFVKSIRSFFVSFTNKIPNPQSDSADVQQFFADMDKSFRSHSLWASCSDEELDSAGEGLEKYVMTKIFNRTFASVPDEKKHDYKLSEKMALVQQFIRPENLDISSTLRNENSWLLAQKELQKINMYKAPRDKLLCILNFCKVINNLLLNDSFSSNQNPPGADEFLPVLIYVTIKANPTQLHSNLLYIQRYRFRSRLVGEVAYYFTNILSAESFIWNINAKTLSMNELEFQKKMESARAFLPVFLSNTCGDMKFECKDNKMDKIKTSKSIGDQSSVMNSSHQFHSQSSEVGKDPSIANQQPVSVSKTQGDSNPLEEQELARYFVEYPFLYASVDDLTIKDVETLLHSYKKIVVDYVLLSKGKTNVNPSFSSPFSENAGQTKNNIDSANESRKSVENSTALKRQLK